MTITYRDIDFSLDEDCDLLASWFNQDVSAMSLTAKAGETVESVRKSYSSNPMNREGFGAFFICIDGKPIGYASFFLNPRHKMSTESVVWPSLAIGDRAYRRKGLVLKLGEEISRRSRKHGATHIEAGVFASNQPMIELLKKYGFSEIGHLVVGPAKIDSVHFIRPLIE